MELGNETWNELFLWCGELIFARNKREKQILVFFLVFLGGVFVLFFFFFFFFFFFRAQRELFV